MSYKEVFKLHQRNVNTVYTSPILMPLRELRGRGGGGLRVSLKNRKQRFNFSEFSHLNTNEKKWYLLFFKMGVGI
jgi:hypothetical protein